MILERATANSFFCSETTGSSKTRLCSWFGITVGATDTTALLLEASGVELGADLEEIIRECELPRAEAELLMSLHKQKGAQ